MEKYAPSNEFETNGRPLMGGAPKNSAPQVSNERESLDVARLTLSKAPRHIFRSSFADSHALTVVSDAVRRLSSKRLSADNLPVCDATAWSATPRGSEYNPCSSGVLQDWTATPRESDFFGQSPYMMNITDFSPNPNSPEFIPLGSSSFTTPAPSAAPTNFFIPAGMQEPNPYAVNYGGAYGCYVDAPAQNQWQQHVSNTAATPAMPTSAATAPLYCPPHKNPLKKRVSRPSAAIVRMPPLIELEHQEQDHHQQAQAHRQRQQPQQNRQQQRQHQHEPQHPDVQHKLLQLLQKAHREQEAQDQESEAHEQEQDQPEMEYEANQQQQEPKGKKNNRRGAKTNNSGKKPPPGMKFLCAFIIGIQEDRVFQVSKRIIGRGGANTKYISELCPGTKIRLRGKGSGFKEPTTNQESNIPLQVNLSSPSKEEYSTAKQEMAHLLNAIYATYKNVTGRDVRLRLNEHPRNPK